MHSRRECLICCPLSVCQNDLNLQQESEHATAEKRNAVERQSSRHEITTDKKTTETRRLFVCVWLCICCKSSNPLPLSAVRDLPGMILFR
jgi:hypothetical protein